VIKDIIGSMNNESKLEERRYEYRSMLECGYETHPRLLIIETTTVHADMTMDAIANRTSSFVDETDIRRRISAE
jgi:hypothetical protein